MRHRCSFRSCAAAAQGAEDALDDLAIDLAALHDVDVLELEGLGGVMAATNLDEHAPTP